MSGRRLLIVATELLVASLLVGGLNLLSPDDPGFLSLYYTPYIAVGLVFAAAYGAGCGIASLGASSLVILAVYPFVADALVAGFSTDGYWQRQTHAGFLPLPAGLAVTFVVGFMRTVSNQTQRDLKSRLAELARENWLLRQKSESLVTVNGELEERVSRRQDAITSLYDQLQKLDTFDLTQGLSVLLETVQIFTGTTKASILRYDETSHMLHRAAGVGWTENDEISESVSIEDTIEGWVYRNNSSFSVRMVLQYDNLKKLDTGRSILTIPMVIDRRVWGVLNIEEMPFEKYNLHTERLLRIIVSLAEHSIAEAVSYESIIRKEEMDAATGLPLFSQFYRMVEEHTRRADARKVSFSIVLLEIVNFGDIAEEKGARQAKLLLRTVADELFRLSTHRAQLFHYKDESQLALFYPNLDYDGVSLFCLETLEQVNTGTWQIDQERVPLDAVIGFAVFEGAEEGPQEVLAKAERLLDMQRV